MSTEDKTKDAFEDVFHTVTNGVDVMNVIDTALSDKKPDEKTDDKVDDFVADDAVIENVDDKGGGGEQEPERHSRFQQRIDAMRKQMGDQSREFSKREEEWKKEKEAFAARLAKLEGGADKSVQDNFDAEYKKTLAELRVAKEKGDTDAELSLTEKLTDMRAALRVAEAVRRMTGAPKPDADKKEQPRPDAPARPMMAQQWLKMNPWFNNPAYIQETRIAGAIDAMLDAEGIDKNSPNYYNRITEEVRKRFPDLPVRGFQMRRPQSPSSSTVAGVGRRGPSGRPQGGGLTAEQLAMARELGIASDPTAMKAYEAMCKQQGES